HEHAQLADQLRRATISVPLNIAEASGKPGRADRARYHAIAGGSAMECGAIVDLLRLQGLASDDKLDEAKSLLVRVVGMLSRMSR
ncbi:MAG: four helix bundle protein, partial [Myxococcales bacterium]|nr:four helix bundle protein [Myxococcales bacterium]